MNKQKEQEWKIDVGGFKQILLRRKATVERFRFPWTYEQSVNAIMAAYQANVELRHRTFVNDEATARHIADAARWLTASRPKFGMMLCGRCGNGKTTLAMAIRDLVAYICRDRNDDGRNGVRQVKALDICVAAKNNPLYFGGLCSVPMLAIDDLGTEPAEVLSYGNVLSPVIDLLSRRYDDQLFTIVTTNLTPKQIREHYGERMADRFNEMFERIIFDNPTYRQS
jgi:DNA replication protein DnaC